MSRVYLLWKGYYFDSMLCGAYSTKEKAERAKKRHENKIQKELIENPDKFDDSEFFIVEIKVR